MCQRRQKSPVVSEKNGRSKFFISLTFNELVLRHAKLGVTEVESSRYHPLKSRKQLEHYEGEAA